MEKKEVQQEMMNKTKSHEAGKTCRNPPPKKLMKKNIRKIQEARRGKRYVREVGTEVKNKIKRGGSKEQNKKKYCNIDERTETKTGWRKLR